VRERHVAQKARGQGLCVGEDASSRREYKKCNKEECQPKNGGILQCKAKLDVVLVLDGSGSIGEAGFEQVRKAGAALVKAFDAGAETAQIAVLMFSGPDSWEKYQKCTENLGTVDLLTDCGLAWVSHFTTGTTALADGVSRLIWPKKTSFVSAALASADAELRSGRAEAQSVVIVITDGKAMNPRKTFQAARALRSKARLMWVPITRKADLANIASWASRPVADNVLVVHDFEDLAKPAQINNIIAAACPVVE